MVFSGMFAFSGCSIVSEDSEAINNKVVMKIGDTNVTKADLINAFYTYYQNNSTYFAYYSEEVIEESFYTWYTVKTMVNELSFKALYDEKTNPNGYIFYTEDDAKTVWDAVEDYFYSQVSAYESALYAKDGISEGDDGYPSWLVSDDEEEEETGFESYKSEAKYIEFTNRKSKISKKLSADEVYNKINTLKANLFKYDTLDENGAETTKDIEDSNQYKYRNDAFDKYWEALVINAKASETSTNRDDVLKAEVLRIYEAYYNSQVNVIFQNYYVQEHLLDYNGTGDKTTLSDKTIVAAFLDDYYSDYQSYQIQDGYVEKMEDSEGASLLMYHYQGKYYYFSVQHILLSFTDTILEQVKALDGYGVTNANEHLAGSYIAARNDIATEKEAGILTEVKNQKDSIIAIGDYYYYDETKKDVWQDGADDTDTETYGKPIYYGYVKLTKHTVGDDGSVTYTDLYSEDKPYTTGDENQTKITRESAGVKLMANIEDVQIAFSENYKIWFELANSIFDGTTTIDEFYENEANEKYEDIRYVLEVAENFKNFDAANNDEKNANKDLLRNKVASLLFIELEWLYSGDSLGNETSNKIGYVVSSQDDNNGNWVVDFAVGAREIFDDMKLTDYTSKDADGKAIYTKLVLTDYGYHIIKLENVYDKEHSSIIDLSKITAEYSLENGSEYVNAVVKQLKQTYICSSSNQTLYDYFYDTAYTSLVGSSSSSGSYFLDLEYQWLAQYYKDNKIETYEKMTYDELVDTLS